MQRSKDFAEFKLRDAVAVDTDDGAGRPSIMALVIAASPDELHLALRGTPGDPDALAPGIVVRVRRGRAPGVRAQVLALEHEGVPVVMVRALSAGRASTNQRSYHRVPVQLRETRATAISAGRAASFRVRMVDLSGGGARLITPRPLREDDIVCLRLPPLEGLDPLDVRARVAWVRPLHHSWQVGVRFVDLSNAVRDRIVRAVFLAEMQLRRAS